MAWAIGQSIIIELKRKNKFIFNCNALDEGMVARLEGLMSMSMAIHAYGGYARA